MKALIKLLIMAADMIQDLISKEQIDLEKAIKINQVIYEVLGAKLDYGRKAVEENDLEKYVQDACTRRGLKLPGMSAGPDLEKLEFIKKGESVKRRGHG